MIYTASVFQCGHFFNFGALEINIHICTGDKKHNRSVLPQLELLESRRPRVSTLLLLYFYAKYKSIRYTVQIPDRSVILLRSQESNLILKYKRHTAPLQSPHKPIVNMWVNVYLSISSSSVKFGRDCYQIVKTPHTTAH